MRSVYSTVLILFLSACLSTPAPAPPTSEQLATMPPEARFDFVLSALDKVPSGDMVAMANQKLELMGLAEEVAQQTGGLTHSQLNALNRHAAGFDALYEPEQTRASDVLIRKGATPLPSQVRAAARSGDLAQLKFYRRHGLKEVDDGKHSPLVYAVQSGNRAIVDLLLQAGFDPDGSALNQDDPMRVPLYVTSRYGKDPKLITLLLDSGARAPINKALSLAQQNPYGGQMVMALQASGARASPAELDQALLLAVTKGKIDSAGAFERGGADPRRIKPSLCRVLPKTPESVAYLYRWCGSGASQFLAAAEIAAEEEQLEMVNALLAAGVSPNSEVSFAFNPFMPEVAMPLGCSGVLKGQPKMMHAFLLAGLSPNSGCPESSLMELAEDYLELCTSSGCEGRYRAIQADLLAMGANPAKDDSLINFDTVMKLAVTAGTGAMVASSGIDAYRGTEIFAATVGDVWGDGNGNSLAALNERYQRGDFSIQDPQLRAMLEQQQSFERQRQNAEAALRKKQADARAQQQASQAQSQRQPEAVAQQSAPRPTSEARPGKSASQPTQVASTASDGEQKQCWVAPKNCVAVTHKWSEHTEGKLITRYKNQCGGRIYMMYCNERNDGSEDCGASGIPANKSHSWSTYNATGRFRWEYLGSAKPDEDWTCAMYVENWGERSQYQ